MSRPTRLFLIRHAEVEERYHRIFGGRIDMELSDRGQEQAARLAEYLRGTCFDAVYASPMKRAQQTLAPMLKHCPARPQMLEALREVDFGDWTGLSWQEVHDRFQVSAYEWLHHLEGKKIANAEDMQAFQARIDETLKIILKSHPEGMIAIVCHGGVIRMILSVLLQIPLTKTTSFDIEYASITQVYCMTHRNDLQLLNFTPWRDLP